jgi:hypothetical protein
MFGFIPNSENEDIFIFTDSNVQFEDRLTSGWQAWSKPSGVKFVNILAIGAGAGGQSGEVGIVAQTKSGGGGGGAGAMSVVTYPAKFLPDMLFIKVGKGGDGGLTNLSLGTAGQPTYVNISPIATGGSVCYANGGASGTTAAAAATYAQMPWASAFPNLLLTGEGGTGSTTGNPATVLFNLFARTIGAQGKSTGSGGSPSAGGSIAAYGSFPAVAGGISPGGKGDDGYWFWKPMAGSGGAGGASSTTAGGAGGNGAYGCGGGGGGAGTVGFDIGTLTSGGSGGDGGSGLVVISCW